MILVRKDLAIRTESFGFQKLTKLIIAQNFIIKYRIRVCQNFRKQENSQAWPVTFDLRGMRGAFLLKFWVKMPHPEFTTDPYKTTMKVPKKWKYRLIRRLDHIRLILLYCMTYSLWVVCFSEYLSCLTTDSLPDDFIRLYIRSALIASGYDLKILSHFSINKNQPWPWPILPTHYSRKLNLQGRISSYS